MTVVRLQEFGTESAPRTPLPHFFVKNIILKHLLLRVGQRCDSKGFGEPIFFRATFD